MSSLLFAIISAKFQTHMASPEVKACKAYDTHTHLGFGTGYTEDTFFPTDKMLILSLYSLSLGRKYI